jgi:hypothetical protein
MSILKAVWLDGRLRGRGRSLLRWRRVDKRRRALSDISDCLCQSGGPAPVELE